MADASLRGCLEEAFAVLGEERPLARRAVATGLGGLCVSVRVGAEDVALRGGEDLVFVEADVGADVFVEAPRSVVVALGEGRTDVLSAVLDGGLALKGEPSALARADLAFRAFLEGAARAPGLPVIWDRFVGGEA